MDTLAGAALLALALVVMNQLRAGTLSTWWRAKFLNAADPIPPGTATTQREPDEETGATGIGLPSASGWTRPLQAPTISPFGVCRDRCARRHQGEDIGGNAYKGDPIGAARGGIVTRTAGDGRCGLRVWVDHGDGWKTVYCHLDAIWVNPGQRVQAGQRVGSCGNTGNAATTPPHVHFEVHSPGGVVNPATIIPPFAGGYATAGEMIPAGVPLEV